MNRRKNALIAAAKYVLAVDRVIKSEPGTQVGTVGKISAEPGAHNVIPGLVRTSLEIRDLSAAKIDKLFAEIQEEATVIAKETGTSFKFELLDVSAVPAMMDEGIRGIIAKSAEELGLSSMSMPSGAGHDAQDMARIAPTGMIFVPSRDGISHSPSEFTSAEDMANGAGLLLHTVLSIDRQLSPRRK
jgi:N-carbamoyl-L-amino-acid hydrolase